MATGIKDLKIWNTHLRTIYDLIRWFKEIPWRLDSLRLAGFADVIDPWDPNWYKPRGKIGLYENPA